MDIGPMGRLFVSCTEAYSLAKISGAVGGEPTPNDSHLRSEAARFDIWGAGFGAGCGDLDELLEGISDLSRPCLVILGSIGYVFTGHFFAENQLLQSLNTILEEIEYMIPEISEYHYEKQEDDEEAIEELEALNDCLFDLVPALERVAAISVKSKNSPSIPFQDPAEGTDPDVSRREPDIHPMIRFSEGQILQRFPKIKSPFLRRLAEATYERYNRLANIDIQGICNDSTNTDESVSSEASTFNDSGFETQSRSSFTSAGLVTNTNPAVVLVARFPPPPVRLEDKVPFKCPYCHKLLSHIASPRDWKKHLLQDLQPWICTFGDCPEDSTTFKTQDHWFKHENDYHRSRYSQATAARHVTAATLISTASEKCPFCDNTQEGTFKRIARHSAKHLRDIALPVLHILSSATARDHLGISQYETSQEKLEKVWEADQDSDTDDEPSTPIPETSEILRRGNNEEELQDSNTDDEPNTPTPETATSEIPRWGNSKGKRKRAQRLSQGSDADDKISPPTLRTATSEILQRGNNKDKLKRVQELVQGSNVDGEPDSIPVPKTESDPGKLRYACPYFKNNPLKHQSCGTWQDEQIHRVKEHCKRFHLKPYQCYNCGNYRCGDQGQLRTHHSNCKIRAIKITYPPDKDILKSASLEARRLGWKDIYRILFPGETVPSPYCESPAKVQAPADKIDSGLVDYTRYPQGRPSLTPGSMESLRREYVGFAPSPHVRDTQVLSDEYHMAGLKGSDTCLGSRLVLGAKVRTSRVSKQDNNYGKIGWERDSSDTGSTQTTNESSLDSVF